MSAAFRMANGLPVPKCGCPCFFNQDYFLDGSWFFVVDGVTFLTVFGRSAKKLPL